MKKKLFALLLAFAMVFCLAACGGSSNETYEEEDTSVYYEEEDASTYYEDEDTSAYYEEEAETSEAAATSASGDSSTAEYLKSVLTIAYAGQNLEDGNYLYVASDDNVDYMCLVELAADGSASVNLLGHTAMSDDGSSITLTDDSTGASLTFTFNANDDGTYTLGLEDGTEFTLNSMSVDDVVDAIVNVAG